MSQRIVLPKIMEVGGGSIEKLGDVLTILGVSHPLVVTDPFMAGQPAFDRVRQNLPEGTAVFSDTVSDPTSEVVELGVGLLKAGQYDGIVAFGGGSSIDTAKAMSILAANGGHIRDYKVPNPIPRQGLPLIAVPTTAGTGSEVTSVTIITDTSNDEKMLIKGLPVQPVAAIVDYEFTYSVPFRTTADTGIDSFCHALEAYTSRRAGPMTDMFALSAITRIGKHLETACHSPQDAAAREQMMLAATEAGIAFSNASVTLIHGMSRPLGAHFHIPHGLSNAMLLPRITRFSIESNEKRFADCARAFGATRARDASTACADLVFALEKQNEDLNVPTPKGFGIDPDAYEHLIPTMARQALASGSPGNNPRIPSVSEIEQLYREVWD